MDLFQKGVIGSKIRLTIKDTSNAVVNVSTATVKQIRYRKPDGTEDAFTANFETDGSDGMINYVTATVNDLDQVGEWEMQGYIELSGGAKIPTSIGQFFVRDNLS